MVFTDFIHALSVPTEGPKGGVKRGECKTGLGWTCKAQAMFYAQPHPCRGCLYFIRDGGGNARSDTKAGMTLYMQGPGWNTPASRGGPGITRGLIKCQSGVFWAMAHAGIDSSCNVRSNGIEYHPISRLIAGRAPTRFHELSARLMNLSLIHISEPTRPY